MVADHRHLQDVSPDDQQAGQIFCIEELPGALAPFCMCMWAYELRYLEVIAELADEGVSVHVHAVGFLWLLLSSLIALMIFWAVSLSTHPTMRSAMSTTLAADDLLLW